MPNIRTLIADDNRVFCSSLKDFLDQEPDIETVGVCHNGKEVLNELEEKEVDALILDLMMPHMDGIGVLKKISSWDLDNLRIIMITAFGDEKIARNASSLGVDYYILKPLNMQQLVARLRQIFSESGFFEKQPMGSSFTVNEGNTVLYARNEENINQKKSLDQKVTAAIQKLGIPAHIKGYHYLRCAIKLVIKDIKYMSQVTKKLYPEVAKKYDTTSSRVERAVRHAIEVAWEKGNRQAMENMFGTTLSDKKDRPTNSQFIARIADGIKLKNNY